MNPVALFTCRGTPYAKLGIECWDAERDARTYTGNQPAICHPPCSYWGRYAHKTAAGPENDRGCFLFALDIVRRVGGVIEHPAHSRAWGKHRLPQPGYFDHFGGWTARVNQSRFGHRALKPTWLYIVGTETLPPIPETRKLCELVPVENMCKAERERTPEEFATWLIVLARSASLHGELACA